eukprot:s1962_g13.t1
MHQLDRLRAGSYPFACSSTYDASKGFVRNVGGTLVFNHGGIEKCTKRVGNHGGRSELAWLVTARDQRGYWHGLGTEPLCIADSYWDLQGWLFWYVGSLAALKSQNAPVAAIRDVGQVVDQSLVVLREFGSPAAYRTPVHPMG